MTNGVFALPKVKVQSSLLKTRRVAQVKERACLSEATIIMESDDDTEKTFAL